MAKVTGIGGVFFKAKGDAKTLTSWYEKNLGMTANPWGGVTLRGSDAHPDDDGDTAWLVVDGDSKHMEPSTAPFSINYRVDDMDSMVAQLKQNGVTILKGPDTHEYGKFLTVMDPDGNKVELWEPAKSNGK